MKNILSSVLILAITLPFTLTACKSNEEQPDETTTAVQSGTESEDYMNITNKGLTASDYIINPVQGITNIGDPYVLYDKELETYYMFTTGGRFRCYSSKTLSGWTQHADAYQVTEKTFGASKFWAPEVHKYNGEYYMVYSAENSSGTHCLGIAKSQSPTGPYIDINDTPLYAPGYSVIDAHLFFDDDGKNYLFFSRDNSDNTINGKRVSQSYGVELSDNLTELIGEPVLCSTPEEPWELKSGSVIWNEGPYVIKHNSTYYLMYSANYYATNNYCVGYSTSQSPLGPYTKAKNNPVLQGDGIYSAGTGHHSITVSPDGTELYIVYHQQTDSKNPSGNRTPAFDKLLFKENGEMYVDGPSSERRTPLPSGALGRYKMTSGFTLTSGYESTYDTAILADGIIPYTTPQSGEAYRFTPDDSKYIELAFDAPISLNSLWLYGISFTALSPASVRVVINDEYEMKKLIFSDKSGVNPAVLNGAALPEGELVSNIKLYFTPNDGESSMSLSEITVVENR